MKTSLLISLIILGIAALFFVPRQNEINLLTTAWPELKGQALALNVPTDPKIPFSSDRTRDQIIRAKNFDQLADELSVFYQKLKDQETGGSSVAYQSQSAAIKGQIAELSPNELRLLHKAISADISESEQSRIELINFATRMFASKNPEAALEITMESLEDLVEKGEGNSNIIHSLIFQYAAKDPAGAAQWIADHNDHVDKMDESQKVWMISSAARKDPVAAFDLIDSLKPKIDFQTYFNLSSGVTSENADAFLSAIRNHPITPEQRESALNGLINSELMRSFESGTSWLENSNLTTDERKTVLANISDFASKDQPGKWLDWITNQEKIEGFNPAYATSRIIQSWTMNDFGSAGKWINSQEDGLQKNEAIKAYAETLAPHEPAAAADWAATLPDGADRTQLLQTIHTSLKAKDPAAADAFAEKHQRKIDQE